MAMRATFIHIFIIHTFTSNWTTYSIYVKIELLPTTTGNDQ